MQRTELTEDIGGLYAGIASEARTALRALVPLAKKKAYAQQLAELEAKRGLIVAALSCDDAKARKNAAIVLGELNGFDGELMAALTREETEFVRPSLILALGRKGSPAAKEYLRAYVPRCTVDKHRAEEEAALRLAVGAMSTAPVIVPEIAWQKVALLTARGHADLTEEELLERELEFTPHEALADCLVIEADSWKTVLSVRTWYDALIIVGRCRNADISISNFFKKDIYAKKLQEMFGMGELSFRIEIAGDKLSGERRAEIMNAVLSAINVPGLTNNPAAYSFELVLMAKGDMLYVFARPSAACDTRFAYRKNTLSASINPVTAAVMMRYIYPYLKRDADVIDPFCGTGTMLVERDRIKGHASLTGVEIKEASAAMAKENLAAARVKAAVLHADIIKFAPRIRYAECIANMPFGLRVSSHDGNERLYAQFLDKLPDMLTDGGLAFLYTNDKRLMRELVAARPALTLVDEALFISGNIHASLFIISSEAD